jgi:DNA-binding NtrC family response regulator
MNKIHVLLVEDDPSQRELVLSILLDEGYQAVAVESVESAIVALKEQYFDVVISDWKLGNLTGLELLKYARQHYSQIGFSMVTAYGTVNHAVQAIQAGADDYLTKPFERQALLLSIDKVFQAKCLRSENAKLNEQLGEQRQLVDLVGNAPSMQAAYQRIEKIAKTTATALITGESGTGKELAARALHQLSSRISEPFIAINCGAIPESLAEAELFGAEKGAYTGANVRKVGKLEAANQGTLFLDEIGELPLSLQAKLLRFLQESTITSLGAVSELKLDVRVIAATHRNLAEMVSKGEFREDLFYRLNIVPIAMPALRHRKEDIGQLFSFFLALFNKRYGNKVDKPAPDTIKALLDYHWPGNVRELSNRVERYVLLSDESELTTGFEERPFSIEDYVLPNDGIDWEEFEKNCLYQALQRCHGNKSAAAKFLGLNYKAFLYRIEKYQIQDNPHS